MKRQENKPVRLNTNIVTRMLCPEGCGLQEFQFQNEKDLCYLACRHLRTAALLSSKGISLENVLANDKLAAVHFPASLETKSRTYEADCLIKEAVEMAKREGWK
jgi:hypothetical protein